MPPLRTWAEINLTALRQNFDYAASLHPDDFIMAVIKANAYGHGLRRIAREMEKTGAEFLGVANCGEARRISNAGIQTNIYILGPTFPDERAEIVEKGWHACISTLEEANHFQALAKEKDLHHPVHLTVDTGMGRGGFLPHDLQAAIAHIATLSHLQLEGIGSHLPSADEDPEFTRQQLKNFKTLTNLTPGLKYVHISNSAGLLGYQTPESTLYRPGLMLYGISPLPDQQKYLTPVMSLMSTISIVRTLPAGHGVSYGRSAILKQDARVATVGLGYGDGYPRAISGKGGEVFIRGQRFPILGRITMDQIMIDVTSDPSITTGDHVELFGENISVNEVAAWADTIPWEIFTGITPRVTRTETY